MDTVGAAFAVLRTGVRFNRKAERGTERTSQVCAGTAQPGRVRKVVTMVSCPRPNDAMY